MTDLSSPLTAAKARVDEARTWVTRINRVQSFDRLNHITAGLRLGDFADPERLAIEAAIDARREYLMKIMWTL